MRHSELIEELDELKLGGMSTLDKDIANKKDEQ